MRARKLFWHRLINGSSRCFKCGHKFTKDEVKFTPFPVDMLLRSVCKKCKESEVK